MALDEVTVLAPATLANLGPGFDVFGLALEQPFDLVTAKRRQGKGVKVLRVEGVGGDSVTLDPKCNTAAVAAARVLELGKADFGISMIIEKGIRPCSGMGSSGASAAGGAFAANLLLDHALGKDELVRCAAEGERASSGTLHADNVAPSLLGGFTIIASYEPLDVIRVTPPAHLGVVVALPDTMVHTKTAREVLPKRLELEQMVFQVGHASALVAGMALGDLRLVGRSVKDALIEPARASLVPFLRQAEEAAMGAGALASFLGGSGPCIASFFDKGGVDGKAIAEAVGLVYKRKGIGCSTWVTGWGEGCRRWER